MSSGLSVSPAYLSSDIGEFQRVSNASTVNLPNTGSVNIVSLTLTSGDWDVQGAIVIDTGSQATVGTSWMQIGLSTTSGVAPGYTTPEALSFQAVNWGPGWAVQLCTGTLGISLVTDTIIYLVFSATSGGGGNVPVDQGVIRARRVR